MAIVNQTPYDIDTLEMKIRHNDGTPLYGEIDMYRRIYQDCQESEYNWYFWYNLHLPIGIGEQSEIQIDFLLACCKGIVIVEVKGGGVGIREGNFYFSDSVGSVMSRSPFDQASDYMYALINNRIINTHAIFIDTICAFPHTRMSKTNNLPSLDLGYKLWSAIQQKNENESFADFCIKVLEADKERKRWYSQDLTDKELMLAIKPFINTEPSYYNYSEESLQSIINWLNVQNLELFKALEKNNRIILEGGPGTGKTTIAKAFIRRYKTLRGLYICWNNLLASKIRNELQMANLNKCEVYQYISFLCHIGTESRLVSYDDFQGDTLVLTRKIKDCLKYLRNKDSDIPYDYIIIDEAQDIFDKGAADVLNALSSVSESGLENGRYLLFFDTEQGYRKNLRELDAYSSEISRYGAHYILNENKRVPTNKEIVDFSNKLLSAESNVDVKKWLNDIEKLNLPTLRIFHCFSEKEVIKLIKELCLKIREKGAWTDYVLLTDSNLRKMFISDDETLYDRILDMEQLKELKPENININNKRLAFTTILSYKGLECKHVKLILNNRSQINKFELYVGMTKAIYDVEILLID